MCCDVGPARAHCSNATNTTPTEPRCQNIPDAYDVCSHVETQAMLKRMRRACSPVVGKGSAWPFGQGRTTLSAIFKHGRHWPKPGAKEKQCGKKGRARHETKVLVPLRDRAPKAPRKIGACALCQSGDAVALSRRWRDACSARIPRRPNQEVPPQ